jgi:hypothetical protein
VNKEYIHEDDVSAEEAAKEKGTWLPQAHENEERQARSEAQEGQGQEIPFRLAEKAPPGRLLCSGRMF